jgi:hypothetical protein
MRRRRLRCRGLNPRLVMPPGRNRTSARDVEGHPIALQLRYLQTLLGVGASQSTTIVFPAPIDMIKPFVENFSRS